jgi:engulfment/cell motility protein 1
MAGSVGSAGGTLTQLTEMASPTSMNNISSPALINPSALIGGSSSHAITAATAGTQTHMSYRWRYYKLSPSKKQLHYGDFTDRIVTRFNSYEKLTEKSKDG